MFEDDLKIGTLGEHLFSTWCTAAHLTSNRSLEEDRTGWDHQVEFPYLKTSLPRDKQSSPIQCRVQVKSTQRRDRKWPIKSSVLKRLIDYSYPSFFLFLEFTTDSEPKIENAFLVHIDKNIIARTLKAIRKNDTQKTPKELHELKVSISYNEKKHLISACGESFRDAVVSYIPNKDIADYQKQKFETISTIGYGEGSYKMQFQVSPEDLNKHIVAQSIGRKGEPVQVRNSVILDNRFNLKNGSIEIERSTEAQLTVKPNILDTCQIRFKDSKFSPSINFQGEFISSANVYSLGKNKLFFRTSLFSFELISFDIPEETQFKVHFTLENSVSLDDIIKLFKVFHTENIGKPLVIEIELYEEKRTLQFGVVLDYDLPDARAVASDMSILKDSFNVDGEVITTPNEVFRQKDMLRALVFAIQNKTDEFRVTLNDDIEESPPEIKATQTLAVQIGKIAVGAIVMFHGTRKEGKVYQVTKSEILRTMVFHDGLPDPGELEKLEKLASESY